MTPTLRELVDRRCSGAVRTESSVMAKENISAFRPLADRLRDANLVQLSCVPVRVIMAADDQSIYQLMANGLAKQEASQWIDALEKAGLDPVLVAGGRKELATRGEWVPGSKLGGTNTADGSLSFEAETRADVWTLSGFVNR